LKHFRFLFYVVFILLSANTFAQVSFQRSWFYTSTDTVSPENITKLPFKLLKHGYDNPPFHNKGTYWFRLDIQNRNPEEDLIIGIKNPHLDSVFLYQAVNGKISAVDTAGNSFKLKDSTYLRYVRFRIKGDVSTVWLKTHLKKENLFPVAVNTALKFYKTESLSFLKLGVYYGIAMVVLIVNLALYFSFKDNRFLCYSVLVFMVMLLHAYADGLYALISRNAIWLNYASLPVMLGATTAIIVFSVKFLELDKKYTYLFWASRAILFLMASCFLTYALFDLTGASILGNMMLPLVLVIYWTVALSKFRKHLAARIYVFASVLSLIFTLNFFLLRFLELSFLNLVTSELKIANILQMFILSVGILHRARKLHKEHAYYRDEIQRYLKEQPKESADNLKSLSQDDLFIQIQEQFGLSDREVDVLKLIADGLTNKQIGETLYLSSNTVKFHVRNIYLKMDISNRAQAVSKIHGAA